MVKYLRHTLGDENSDGGRWGEKCGIDRVFPNKRGQSPFRAKRALTPF